MRKKGFGTANQASTFLLQTQTRKDKKRHFKLSKCPKLCHLHMRQKQNISILNKIIRCYINLARIHVDYVHAF